MISFGATYDLVVQTESGEYHAGPLNVKTINVIVCEECGSLVVDLIRHENWHNQNDIEVDTGGIQ